MHMHMPSAHMHTASHTHMPMPMAVHTPCTRHAHTCTHMPHAQVRNIHGTKLLTQLGVERAPAEAAAHVDQFLKEVAWRLLGGSHALEAHLELTNPKQVWIA